MLKDVKEDIMKLIEQLETYRLEKKLSQQKLAKILGVHYVTLNRWIMGKKKPNKIWVYHIKKFLKERGILK
ncbi:MAG: helix-turn-helix transcriptional regulator [Candidatus Omnitrophica bacterium]|nr:helix-turn-helix transcriptional regulator [Candidatus Omnitrophota bacterium]